MCAQYSSTNRLFHVPFLYQVEHIVCDGDRIVILCMRIVISRNQSLVQCSSPVCRDNIGSASTTLLGMRRTLGNDLSEGGRAQAGPHVLQITHGSAS